MTGRTDKLWSTEKKRLDTMEHNDNVSKSTFKANGKKNID